MLIASSPGKAHLAGEHAVVYGEPAIIAAVDLRTTVTCEKSEEIRYIDKRFNTDSSWSINDVLQSTEKTLDLWNICFAKIDFTELFDFVKKNEYENYKKSAIGIILDRIDAKEGLTVTVDSAIPVGSGLASSASLAVSLVRGISELNCKSLSLDEVNNIALELENIIHGTPSGGDNSACCYGGLIWFQKSQPINTIMSLTKEIPYELENFLLVYTKPPERTTGELVQVVRNLENNYRNERVNRIGTLVNELKDVLIKRDFKRMKEIMNENQKLLSEMNVSCKEIDEVAAAVRNIGGAAKLSGGGGGGAMLCFHEDKPKLIQLINNFGYKYWDVGLAVGGVQVEK
jgi:mevalonate kinase